MALEFVPEKKHTKNRQQKKNNTEFFFDKIHDTETWAETKETFEPSGSHDLKRI